MRHSFAVLTETYSFLSFWVLILVLHGHRGDSVTSVPTPDGTRCSLALDLGKQHHDMTDSFCLYRAAKE